jgi:serine protease Do
MIIQRILSLILVSLLVGQSVMLAHAESFRSRLDRLKQLPEYSELTEEEIAVIEVVKNVSPAVVGIRVLNSANRVVSSGTGFVVQEDGLIVTNKHVVTTVQNSTILVMVDETEYEAEVEAIDSFNDIALIRLKNKSLTPVELSEDDNIHIGQTVIAIGNPFGLSKTVTRGVVSAMDRSIQAQNGAVIESLKGVIQTDAAINPGNSGGPLLSSNGKVIGINVATSKGGDNIAFAIPVSEIRRAFGSFSKTGKITKKFLGVRYVEMTPQLKREQKLRVSRGALVIEVVSGSAAEKSGIEAGDVIVRVGMSRVTSQDDLEELIRTAKIREQVVVYKKDKKRLVPLTIQFDEVSQISQ